MFAIHARQPFRASDLLKLVQPRSYKRAAQMLLAEPAFNVIVDRVVDPVPLEALAGVVESAVLDVESAEVARWLNTYIPGARMSYLQKKALELFSTWRLLETRAGDDYMDVAGARQNYIRQLRARRRYVQDLYIPTDLKRLLGPDILYVMSDARAIPLPDESLDKISCHDAFKHFHRDSDSRFIEEAQRLLRPGGRCAIAQVFIGDRYVELTRSFSFDNHFDLRAHYLIDPSATVVDCGYVRIYDVRAFQERVLAYIDEKRFRATLVELRVDGAQVPDLGLRENHHVARMNRPFRTLVVERIA